MDLLRSVTFGPDPCLLAPSLRERSRGPGVQARRGSLTVIVLDPHFTEVSGPATGITGEFSPGEK